MLHLGLHSCPEGVKIRTRDGQAHTHTYTHTSVKGRIGWESSFSSACATASIAKSRQFNGGPELKEPPVLETPSFPSIGRKSWLRLRQAPKGVDEAREEISKEGRINCRETTGYRSLMSSLYSVSWQCVRLPSVPTRITLWVGRGGGGRGGGTRRIGRFVHKGSLFVSLYTQGRAD